MRRTRVPRKVTRCTKLRGAQRSPELAFRNTDFCALENLIFLALSDVLSMFHSILLFLPKYKILRIPNSLVSLIQ